MLPDVAVPGFLLLFPLGCACVGSARGGGRLAGEGSLLEVVLVLFAVEAGAVKKNSGFLQLMQVSVVQSRRVV
jgi:hypothetical protein